MKTIIHTFILSFAIFLISSCTNSTASSNKTNSDTLIIEDTTKIIIKENSIPEKKVPKSYIFTKEELMGKVKPASDTNFVEIDEKYTAKPNIYLRKQAYISFCKMYAAAKKEGVTLNVISAFRSNYHQQLIWEGKWTGKRKVGGEQLNLTIKDTIIRAKTILKFSSMPGSSRHHWGTDVDVYSLNNSSFDNGQGLKTYQWLKANAVIYGFCQVYSADRTIGYNEEKWHWSYLPIATPMLEEFKQQIKLSDFNSFKGSQTAKDLNIIEDYVFGISEECL